MQQILSIDNYYRIHSFSASKNRDHPLEGSASIEQLIQLIDHPPKHLFLDIDGTISEFHPNPSQSFIPKNVLHILNELTRYTRLTLVTGRSVAQTLGLISPFHFDVLGSHGIEYLTHDATQQSTLVKVRPEQVKQLENAVRDAVQIYQNLRVEIKTHSVALHFREHPELEVHAYRIVQQLLKRFKASFELKAGKLVYELVPIGANKGAAIQHVLTNSPQNNTPALFIGDDLTDEAGFGVINKYQGISVKVGEGSTQAHHRLQGVAEVHVFLEILLQHLERHN